MPRVTSFLFDDDNEEKLAAHGLTIEEVDQILDEEHVIVPNRKGRRAPILLIGRNRGGWCIAVPLEPTYDVGCWRPITAWPCKASELRLLRGR